MSSPRPASATAASGSGDRAHLGGRHGDRARFERADRERDEVGRQRRRGRELHALGRRAGALRPDDRHVADRDRRSGHGERDVERDLEVGLVEARERAARVDRLELGEHRVLHAIDTDEVRVVRGVVDDVQRGGARDRDLPRDARDAGGIDLLVVRDPAVDRRRGDVEAEAVQPEMIASLEIDLDVGDSGEPRASRDRGRARATRDGARRRAPAARVAPAPAAPRASPARHSARSGSARSAAPPRHDTPPARIRSPASAAESCGAS